MTHSTHRMRAGRRAVQAPPLLHSGTPSLQAGGTLFSASAGITSTPPHQVDPSEPVPRRRLSTRGCRNRPGVTGTIGGLHDPRPDGTAGMTAATLVSRREQAPLLPKRLAWRFCLPRDIYCYCIAVSGGRGVQYSSVYYTGVALIWFTETRAAAIQV